MRLHIFKIQLSSLKFFFASSEPLLAKAQVSLVIAVYLHTGLCQFILLKKNINNWVRGKKKFMSHYILLKKFFGYKINAKLICKVINLGKKILFTVPMMRQNHNRMKLILFKIMKNTKICRLSWKTLELD